MIGANVCKKVTRETSNRNFTPEIRRSLPKIYKLVYAISVHIDHVVEHEDVPAFALKPDTKDTPLVARFFSG